MNLSRETGLMKKWPEGGPRLVWKYSPLGLGYSGVSLAEGRIFTAGDFDDVEKVIALDLDNCHGSVMQAGGYLYGSSCRAGGRGFFCAELLTGRLAFREKRMEKLSLTAAEGLCCGTPSALGAVPAAYPSWSSWWSTCVLPRHWHTPTAPRGMAPGTIRGRKVCPIDRSRTSRSPMRFFVRPVLKPKNGAGRLASTWPIGGT